MLWPVENHLASLLSTKALPSLPPVRNTYKQNNIFIDIDTKESSSLKYKHAHRNPDICRHYNIFTQASCMQTSEAFSVSLSVGKTLPPIKSISVIINALRNEDLKWHFLCIVPFHGLLWSLSLTVTCWI